MVTTMNPTMSQAMVSTKHPAKATRREVTAYYDRKSELVLKKYGPGPRVHFHSGVMDLDTAPAPDIEGVRQQLIKAQENVLHEAAQIWNAKKYLSGTIVDVGCGLGGGALFWAQEYGARVFALTNVPRQIELITRFASQAKVSDRVFPTLGDAHKIPGDQRFDAAVALDSSCYFNRDIWFNHLSQRLQPQGRVFIQDAFLEKGADGEIMDRYYKTRTGRLAEYKAAAATAGFHVDQVGDITARNVLFWEFSVIHSRRIIESGLVQDSEDIRRLEKSIEFQTWFGQKFKNREFLYLLLSFVKS